MFLRRILRDFSVFGKKARDWTGQAINTEKSQNFNVFPGFYNNALSPAVFCLIINII